MNQGVQVVGVYVRDQDEALDAGVAKGAMPPLVLVVDDCRAAYERMRAQGVEFTQEPIDCFGTVRGFSRSGRQRLEADSGARLAGQESRAEKDAGAVRGPGIESALSCSARRFLSTNGSDRSSADPGTGRRTASARP